MIEQYDDKSFSTVFNGHAERGHRALVPSKGITRFASGHDCTREATV